MKVNDNDQNILNEMHKKFSELVTLHSELSPENSIRGACSFQLHFPSLYIKANEVKDFSNEVNFITFLIEGLNKDLKKDYSSEWVLQ